MFQGHVARAVSKWGAGGGEIRIGGETVNHCPPQRRNVAMVFQQYALYPHKTVRQNLAFPLRMMKVPKAERQQRVARVAETLGLTPWLDRRPKHLSGGLRPEAFSPAEDGARENGVRVRIAASEALGHENLVYFESPAPVFDQPAAGGEEHAAARMVARLPAAGPPPASGDSVVLTVDARRLVLFDGEGKALCTKE